MIPFADFTVLPANSYIRIYIFIILFFTYIKKNRPDINDYIETVPHFNWIKNIIISRNPELQVVEVEGKEYYGVKFPEIVDRSDKLVNLDKCLGYIFAMISEVLVKELGRFEIMYANV